MFSIQDIFIILGIFTSTCIFDSASNENSNSPNIPRYLPSTDDEIPVFNQRIQQIMQESNTPWQGPKLKNDKIDVNTEIEKLNNSYVYQPKWPDKKKKLGAVTAVSFDKDKNVVIFHRVDRIWTQDTFDANNIFEERSRGTISENTVVAFDHNTGEVVYEWGKNLFFMPHGLTVDHENNVWVTDVALHQVMKFGPQGSNDIPLMTLGTKFLPGSGRTKIQFCKPTSVAVLPDGDFFVADGYCNARIVKFSKKGVKILEWGERAFHGEAYDVAPQNFFAVPHALTLAPELGLVCVADRENGRVQCFYTTNGTFHSQYHNEIVGDRLFSVDYAPISGGQLFVVNGPTAELSLLQDHNVRGYVIDMKTKQVLSKFAPKDLNFFNPHDIAVTHDGNEIYVAELDPNRIHKFVNKKIAKNTIFLSATKKPTITVDDKTDLPNTIINKNRPGTTAVLVIALILIFSLLTFGLALLIARRRKRGCFPFGVRNRRHAWDFPTVKSDGFKLGNLLDRKRGFEKLDQNASDEEPDASTNMLSSAQFA